jgi:diketogulonate reductase-like aldo/keto reductase
MNKLTDCTTLHNGVKMPWVGLGVWKTKEGEEVENAVRTAIEVGYRSIDTAAVYKNEVGVGRAIKASGIAREELFVTTKVWNKDQGYESTLAAFEESRKKLGLEYIDLYLIHWVIKDKYKQTWRALEKLYKDGYVRAIGVSNHGIQHIQELMNESEVKPMVNQVEFHPYLTQKELLAFCKKEGIQMEAWSPLFAGGELLKQPLMQELSQKYNKSPAQVILRWDLQNGVVTIPKSVHESRIRENADIFDFELSEDDMARISALNRNQRTFDYDPDNITFGLE